MSLTTDETVASKLAHGIIFAALEAAPKLLHDRVERTLDPTRDAERVLLTAAAIVMAQRAGSSREQLMRLVAEQQLFLEARADDAQARAVAGRRS